MTDPKRLLIPFFLLLINIFLFAGSTGKIAGIVKDKSTGDVLIGVNITLEGTTLGASTDIDGTFIILNVPPGTYVVDAQYIGYSNTITKNVQVNIDLTTELDITLQEEALEMKEAVTVVAQQDLVTKDLTASTATVNSERIDALPVTEISEVLELQAGYVDGHARGGRKGCGS